MEARPGIVPTQSKGKHATWRDLRDHHAVMQGLHLRSLFANDPARGEQMTAEAAGVYLDYSKNRINDETVRLLIAALEPDETVIGGGNVGKLAALPPYARAGDNANAFRGGFLLWQDKKRNAARSQRRP